MGLDKTSLRKFSVCLSVERTKMSMHFQWKHVVAITLGMVTVLAIFALEYSRRSRLKVSPAEQQQISETLSRYGSDGRIPDRMNTQQTLPAGKP